MRLLGCIFGTAFAMAESPSRRGSDADESRKRRRALLGDAPVPVSRGARLARRRVSEEVAVDTRLTAARRGMRRGEIAYVDLTRHAFRRERGRNLSETPMMKSVRLCRKILWPETSATCSPIGDGWIDVLRGALRDLPRPSPPQMFSVTAAATVRPVVAAGAREHAIEHAGRDREGKHRCTQSCEWRGVKRRSHVRCGCAGKILNHLHLLCYLPNTS